VSQEWQRVCWRMGVEYPADYPHQCQPFVIRLSFLARGSGPSNYRICKAQTPRISSLALGRLGETSRITRYYGKSSQRPLGCCGTFHHRLLLFPWEHARSHGRLAAGDQTISGVLLSALRHITIPAAWLGVSRICRLVFLRLITLLWNMQSSRRNHASQLRLESPPHPSLQTTSTLRSARSVGRGRTRDEAALQLSPTRYRWIHPGDWALRGDVAHFSAKRDHIATYPLLCYLCTRIRIIIVVIDTVPVQDELSSDKVYHLLSTLYHLYH